MLSIDSELGAELLLYGSFLRFKLAGSLHIAVKEVNRIFHTLIKMINTIAPFSSVLALYV